MKLNKELRDNLRTDSIGSHVHHPLLICAFHPSLSEHLNEMLANKQKLIALALEEQNLEVYINLHEKPYRLEALEDYPLRFTDEEYWSAVKNIYINNDFLMTEEQEWSEILSTAKSCPVAQDTFMTKDELALFNALPESITVFRGFIPDINRAGFSFSLDRAVAERFSRSFRGKLGGEVREETVNKSDIFALITSRDESEIVLYEPL